MSSEVTSSDRSEALTNRPGATRGNELLVVFEAATQFPRVIKIRERYPKNAVIDPSRFWTALPLVMNYPVGIVRCSPNQSVRAPWLSWFCHFRAIGLPLPVSPNFDFEARFLASYTENCRRKIRGGADLVEIGCVCKRLAMVHPPNDPGSAERVHSYQRKPNCQKTVFHVGLTES